MQWDAGLCNHAALTTVQNSRAHTYNTSWRPGSWDAAAAVHHVYTRTVQRTKATRVHDVTRRFTRKSSKRKISQGRTRSHIDIYTRHQSGASTLSFLRGRFQSGRRERNKNQKDDSSFSQFPLVRHLLDQLHATAASTNSASTATTAGQRLPCAEVQDPVWVQSGPCAGRWEKTWEVDAPGTPSTGSGILAESGGRLAGQAKLSDHEEQEMRRPPGASELRGLPAHLPRNLASFSPSVDDRDGGGSRPRQLVHRRHFLLHGRGGATVLVEHFDGRGQRGHGRT